MARPSSPVWRSWRDGTISGETADTFQTTGQNEEGSETEEMEERLESVLEEYKQSLTDVSQLIGTSKHNTSDQETREVFARLSKAADEIQQLLEDGVNITNLLTPLQSGSRLIRDILSNKKADRPLSGRKRTGLKRHASRLEGSLSDIRKKETLRRSTLLTNRNLHDNPIAIIKTSADLGECLEPLLQEEENGDLKYTLKCPTAGLFECKFTSLMFKMETAGEVEYHSVPWADKLENYDCEPAGPLYDISCFPGTPVQIHLPHCEVISDGKLGHLRVAHITGDGLEIIKPKEITESHVVIDVTGLSIFGLITSFIDYLLGRNIRAHVLLFLQTRSNFRTQELQVLLVSSNSDTKKVKKQRDKDIYIERNPNCIINTCRHYSLFTDPPGLIVTPNSAQYVECSKNISTAFTVLCSTEKELKLILKDLKDKTKELWKSVVNIEDAAAAAGSSQTNFENRTKYMIGDQHFIDRHRIRLIESITTEEPILDRLLAKNMINHENFTLIRAKSTSTQRMRELFDVGSIRSTTKGKDSLYDVLMEVEPLIMEELKSTFP